LDGCKVRSVPLVEELRIVKSKAEVELIRHAARFANLGVQRLLAASHFGSCVVQGLARTRTVVAKMISEIDGWEPISISNRVLMATWAAPRSAQPHSIPKLNDRLEGGPHIALVLTAVLGYAAECERTYFTSTPTPEARRAFDVMLEARALAMGMTRPDTSCTEIDAAVNHLLCERGYEANLLHRTGHGLGLARHAEAPWVAQGSEDVLAPGMVISIEPGIYLPGVGGFRHSDTILVTEDECECLTRHPTDLESLTLRGLKPWSRLKGLLITRSLPIPVTPQERAKDL
jgi:Xaa-Pro dipeptidase